MRRHQARTAAVQTDVATLVRTDRHVRRGWSRGSTGVGGVVRPGDTRPSGRTTTRKRARAVMRRRPPDASSTTRWAMSPDRTSRARSRFAERRGGRRASGWCAAVLCALLLGAAPASASALAVADWTAVAGNVATGTLSGHPISLPGTHVFPPPVSTLDATWPYFAGPDFTPQLAKSDVIQVAGFTGDHYTLQFGVPVTDPVLHVGSLGSRLDFPTGTQISRVSGDGGFTVSGASVIGTVRGTIGPDGTSDASGTIRLLGTFASISFATTPLFTGPEDGILIQVLAPPPGKQAPSPMPSPPAPRVTALRLVAAPRAGRPALVTAQVSGPYRRLLWNVRGGPAPELVSGP